MTPCPMCAAPWREGHMLCECGYDLYAVEQLESERHDWRKRRNGAFAAWLAGFAVLLFVPAISTLLAAAIGGLLTSAGFVVGVWGAVHVRSINRRIRAAQTPKQLPEARIV